MEFYTLASGSSGNCSLVCAGDTLLLIDAGISCRRIEQSLRALGRTLGDLTAVFITHEHTDHIGGLATDTGLPGAAGAAHCLFTLKAKHLVIHLESLSFFNQVYFRPWKWS